MQKRHLAALLRMVSHLGKPPCSLDAPELAGIVSLPTVTQDSASGSHTFLPPTSYASVRLWDSGVTWKTHVTLSLRFPDSSTPAALPSKPPPSSLLPALFLLRVFQPLPCLCILSTIRFRPWWLTSCLLYLCATVATAHQMRLLQLLVALELLLTCSFCHSP